jgi:GTP cyclohydrolase I
MANLPPSNHDESEADPYRHITEAVRAILASIGEDLDREGLIQTPKRVAQMYTELTAGYQVDLNALVNGAIFHVDYPEMVVVLDIDFSSLCEHHLLPFFGKVHVAYIPDGRVIGLSKIPRIVEMYARRLQMQERMTVEIADTLQHILEPRGVGIIVEAKHMCTMGRGVEKINARMVTRAMLGNFEDANIRNEFISHIGYKDEDSTQHHHDHQHEERYA